MRADEETEEETSDEGETTDEEVEVKKPQGISLLMFVLIALTGGVLFILNITGVVCYLRRRSFFQGISVGSSRKHSAYDVPSPSLVDHLSLSSADDIPPPDYEQVMGSLGRVSFGGSLVDVRRSSRGTPSLARSSPIVTSSSTISAGNELDIDIIAPPDDFSNGLISLPSDEGMSSMHGRDSWADLENMSSSEQLVPPPPSRKLPICHQPLQHIMPRGSSSPFYAAATFHHSMDSLSQLYSQPHVATPPRTLSRPPSTVIFHGQPHIHQHMEHQQHLITLHHEQQQQQQHQRALQQHQHYQFPMLDGAQAFGYSTQQLREEEQYYLQQQLQYQPPPSEPTTPLSPSYASLDPSTLYAQHSTFFGEGSRSTSTFTDQRTDGSPDQTTERFSHT